MKKTFIILLIIVILVAGFFVKKNYDDKKEAERIERVKKGWYVELLTEELNVRTLPSKFCPSLGKVFKGEVFEVLEVNTEDPTFYWYRVEIDDSTKGWLANDKNGTFLKDYNNPTDVATPTIRFYEEVYNVYSIDNISYSHLVAWDDKEDYKITHKVYHEVVPEVNKDQYWIKYTITDATGKHSSKTQRIVFAVAPAEEQVTPFENYPN